MPHTDIARPPRLRPGDRVRVVAPASPFDRARFERGRDVLTGWGLQVEVPAGAFSSSAYLAGDDEARAQDLAEALADPAVAAIWCARGGYGSSRILPRIASAVRSGPKLLIGFSDISALIAIWYERFRCVALHGPVVTSLADEPAASRELLWRLLSAEVNGLGYPLDSVGLRAPVEGPLYVSNLTLLAHLAGTPYCPRLDGCILCVEETGERPYRIDRLWTQLRLAGVLAGVAAIALGDFVDCDEPDGSIVAGDALARGLMEIGVPVVRGLAIGHRAPNSALPVGVRARLEPGRLVLLEEATAPR
ncbi:MAG: LD-carboxypeptidase [Deltaproteobacteria bacterium]|nr:LD-carboxypeptidase [Deltaproteobacteria bacterium]